MSKLIDQIKDFANNYIEDKSNYIKASKMVPSWTKIVEELPKLFKLAGGISDNYKIKGSIGLGVMTKIPWIGFFDKALYQHKLAITWCFFLKLT